MSSENMTHWVGWIILFEVLVLDPCIGIVETEKCRFSYTYFFFSLIGMFIYCFQFCGSLSNVWKQLSFSYRFTKKKKKYHLPLERYEDLLNSQLEKDQEIFEIGRRDDLASNYTYDYIFNSTNAFRLICWFLIKKTLKKHPHPRNGKQTEISINFL